MLTPAWGLQAAFGACVAGLIAWNLSQGVRLSALPGTSRGFRVLSALDAFLFLPALVIGLLAPTAPGARILGPLAWLWPLAAVGILAQAVWTTFSGRASRLVAVPITLFDVLVAWIAVVRWGEGLGAGCPAWALVPGVAASSLTALVLGNQAFLWGAAVLVPALLPAAPARWRGTRAARALVATGCAFAVVAVGLEGPSAYAAIRATLALGARDAASPARGEFAIGVRVFGTLSNPPTATVARNDLSFADSLGVTALHVELAADGTSASTIDSIARIIDQRGDSVQVVVTLDLGPVPWPARVGEAGMAARLAAVARIVRRLHPDVLVPADGLPPVMSDADIRWWQSYYVRVSAAARSVDRTVTVAFATNAGARADSALADWVMRGDSPVDAIVLSVRTYSADPTSFVRALDAMARWVSLARVAPAVWIVGVPASPAVTGELAQQALTRHALAWSAAHAWVRGVIIGDASDELSAVGLRTALGRSRRALADVSAGLHASRELAPLRPSADSLPSVDTATRGTRRPDTDSHSPPPR